MEIKRKNGKIYAPLKDKWLVETPEETVRQKYIVKLVTEYGYSLEQMDQEITTNNCSDRGNGAARADIVIWKTKEDKENNFNSFIVVECKAETVKIRRKDFYQGSNYAANTNSAFLVLTNNKETKYYKIDKSRIPNNDEAFQEIIAIPKACDIDNEKEIKRLLTQTKTFTRDEFTRVLFSCHNIIRNNDKLSPEAAFDEISKILFMKIKYEREQKGTMVFTKKKFQDEEKVFEKNIRPSLIGTHMDLPYMQYLFNNTKKEFKNDELFEDNEIIKIRQNSFESILKLLEKYNLSDTADDIKGIAFEQFLGKTFRGELGQFFTPRTIVDFMIDILEPQEGEIICDPACGSGGFLIKAFEYVRSKIENDIQKRKDIFKEQILGTDYNKLTDKEQTKRNKDLNSIFNQLNKELETVKKDGIESRLYKLSHKCIYGTDANPRMARTSKMNMIMHGDGHGGVHHHDGLLNVNGIFENRFDVIVTNPPFGSRVDKDLKITEADRFTDKAKIKYYMNKYGSRYTEALEQVNNNIGKKLLDQYDLGKSTTLTEVLFIERCFRLLNQGGRMGIVLPEGVLNNGRKMQKIRDYFEGKGKIILVCSIPQDVFIAAGATVKPSILFFKKFTATEEKKYLQIKEQATIEIDNKYQPELDVLESSYKNMKKDKVYREKLKDINNKKANEIKQLIKARFDYIVPMVKVDKAGITTTGAPCENELIDVAKEYKNYNEHAQLWDKSELSFKYSLDNTLGVLRVHNSIEEKLGELNAGA